MFSLTSAASRIFAKRDASDSTNQKSGKNAKNLIGTPLFNVLLMVALMLAVSTVFRFLEWQRLRAHAQIQISDSFDSSGDKDHAKSGSVQSAQIFSGEVFDTSIRLRETAAFGFAVCAALLDEAAKNKTVPGSINNLLKAVVSRGLLPPGIKIENGEIRSATSKIYVRYQVEPMRLEFVSLSLDARSGPALMLRFPLASADGKNIAYFQSASVNSVNLPAPFAPAHEIIKSGWTLETWRGVEMNGNQNFVQMLVEEQDQLNRFAPSQNSSR